MHTLIIADDEPRIRESFLRIVDWPSLGFEVVGCYADGSDVLAHMRRVPADVVLTDIRMQSVSGLDVAKALRDEFPGTVCVLVSGFQEFDFARQALAFGVADYLLKPTRLTELERVFRRIALELDGARQALRHEEARRREMARMSEDLRRQFLLDLYVGTVRQPELLDAQLARFFPCGPKAPGVLLKSWRVRRPERSDALASEHGADSTDHALDMLFRVHAEGFAFDPVVLEPGRLVLLALVDLGQGEAGRAQAMDAVAEAVEQAESMLEITFTPWEETWFESAQAFAMRKKPRLTAQPGEVMRLDDESLLALQEQMELLNSYLAGRDETQADALLDGLVAQLENLPIALVRNVLVDIFARVREQLHTLRMLPKDSPLPRYDTLTRCQTMADVRAWCMAQLKVWYQNIDVRPHTRRVISLIRQYIQAEYMRSPSLERAAEQVFLNPVYVSRLFKHETGETFTDYILRVRMEAAKKLLDDSVLKVYEVGQRVGYANARYFYRAFKAFAGMTPNEYRQRERPESP